MASEMPLKKITAILRQAMPGLENKLQKEFSIHFIQTGSKQQQKHLSKAIASGIHDTARTSIKGAYEKWAGAKLAAMCSPNGADLNSGSADLSTGEVKGAKQQDTNESEKSKGEWTFVGNAGKRTNPLPTKPTPKKDESAEKKSNAKMTLGKARQKD